VWSGQFLSRDATLNSEMGTWTHNSYINHCKHEWLPLAADLFWILLSLPLSLSLCEALQCVDSFQQQSRQICWPALEFACVSAMFRPHHASHQDSACSTIGTIQQTNQPPKLILQQLVLESCPLVYHLSRVLTSRQTPERARQTDKCVLNSAIHERS